MIQIGLCDDDLSVLKDMQNFIKEYQILYHEKINCVIYKNYTKLLTDFSKGVRLDILFMEAILQQGNGIKTAKEIRKYDRNVKIIFLTTTAEYAVQSYSVKAFFYQLKPMSKEICFQQLDSLIESEELNKKRFMVLHCKNEIVHIDLDKLEYGEVIGRTIILHMAGGEIFESFGHLEKFYTKLIQVDYSFIRPHRSYVVNMKYIQTITRSEIGMKCLYKIPIPHGKYTGIRNQYLKYIDSCIKRGIAVNSLTT